MADNVGNHARDPVGRMLRQQHPWHLVMGFLDSLEGAHEMNEMMPLCILRMSGCVEGVMLMCCGAPICHRCMLSWWNALRERDQHRLCCPHCNGFPAEQWFRRRNGQIIEHPSASVLRWLARRDVLRCHFVSNNSNRLKSLAMNFHCRWLTDHGYDQFVESLTSDDDDASFEPLDSEESDSDDELDIGPQPMPVESAADVHGDDAGNMNDDRDDADNMNADDASADSA